MSSGMFPLPRSSAKDHHDHTAPSITIGAGIEAIRDALLHLVRCSTHVHASLCVSPCIV
jgi:hypothetical protein